jgi:hypothetical protein
MAGRLDRAAWLPVAVVVAAVGVLAFLVLGGDRTDDDDDAAPTVTTGAEGFTIESDDGSLTFDRDDDEASVEFSGPDEEGRFAFDLDGDGIVAAGEGGSFELDGGEPPNWPGEFPLPRDSTAVRGSVVDAGDLVQLSTTYRTTVPSEDVVAFYLDALADEAPLVEESPPDSPEGPITITFEGRWAGFLSISRTAEPTVVAVQLYSEPVPSD